MNATKEKGCESFVSHKKKRIFATAFFTALSGMTTIRLDMIQTAGIGALALIVGMVMTRRVAFLQNFCIPSPVIGAMFADLLNTAVITLFLNVM